MDPKYKVDLVHNRTIHIGGFLGVIFVEDNIWRVLNLSRFRQSEL